jgi:flagellar hook-length control protein FliK
VATALTIDSVTSDDDAAGAGSRHPLLSGAAGAGAAAIGTAAGSGSAGSGSAGSGSAGSSLDSPGSNTPPTERTAQPAAATAAGPADPAAGTSATDRAGTAATAVQAQAAPPVAAGMSDPGSAGATVAGATFATAGASGAAPPAGSTTGSERSAGPVSVPEQIVSHVSPLRRGPDGSHQLTLRLAPEHLGPVTVTAAVRAGTVHLSLVPGTGAGHEALRGAVAELQADLTAAGFTSATVEVRGDPRGSGPGHGRDPAAAGEGQGRSGSRPDGPGAELSGGSGSADGRAGDGDQPPYVAPYQEAGADRSASRTDQAGTAATGPAATHPAGSPPARSVDVRV